MRASFSKTLLASCLSTQLLFLSVAFPVGAQSVGRAPETKPNEARAEALELAAQIDSIIELSWGDENVTPAGAAEDYEFLRRAYLDLTGVIPSVADVRDFVADQSADKRYALIDDLLESPRHATHLANTWRRILLPDGFPAERSDDAIGMQRWLRDRFSKNVRYDRIVGDFLTATGSAETGPALFYQALEVKPEKLAASTARSFLGIQIQCAQCHDHPFDDWSQRDFWEYAAFFARVSGDASMQPGTPFVLADKTNGEVTLPEEDEAIPPAFPGDDDVDVDPDTARRLQLSIWLASGNNPYLARATANRVWWHLFGTGIVDPVDDLSEMNEPSHPEALDALSEYFIKSKYNLRDLYRVVAYTKAYARSSKYTQEKQPDPESFAVMAMKSLTAEQLYDSMARALQNNPNLSSNDEVVNSLANPLRRQFLVTMSTGTSEMTEYAAGLQQTLHMLNNPQISAVTSDEQSGLLAALEAPFLKNEQKLEAIFLSTLNRKPTSQENERFASHLSSAESQPAALADIVWVLLNSAEFQLNH